MNFSGAVGAKEASNYTCFTRNIKSSTASLSPWRFVQAKCLIIERFPCLTRQRRGMAGR